MAFDRKNNDRDNPRDGGEGLRESRVITINRVAKVVKVAVVSPSPHSW